MNDSMRIGVVFSSPPHGSASGREGLDAVLSTSNYHDDIALFFVGDGVMQLLDEQKTDAILSRDYISTFKLLSLCDVEEIFVCHDSLAERGLQSSSLVIEAKKVTADLIGDELEKCSKLLRF